MQEKIAGRGLSGRCWEKMATHRHIVSDQKDQDESEVYFRPSERQGS